MYGGWDRTQDAVLDDNYVLSIPSFQWIRASVINDPDRGSGRCHQKCQMWNDGQLIVTGGFNTTDLLPSQMWDASHPPIKVMDTSEYVWLTQFMSNLNYTVPGMVSDVIGGK